MVSGIATEVSEEDEIVTVCALLSAVEAIERSVTITLLTTDGTGTFNRQYNIIIHFVLIFAARAGRDYISVVSLETFAPGSMDNDTECVDISIVDNDALEEEETFGVTVTSQDPSVLLGINATVTITDDDGQCYSSG